MKKSKTLKKGQALIMMIIFMLIASIIISAAVAVTITNSAGSNKLQQGNIAYQMAESGIENELLRLLRNPLPTGESLTFAGGGTVSVSVSGAFPSYTITSTGYANGIQRKVQATTDYTGNKLSIISWKEIAN